jgi:hypothetical protein
MAESTPQSVQFRLREAAHAAAEKLPEFVDMTAEVPDVWMIVVMGNFDPRTHHPRFYEAIEAISAEERDFAEKLLEAGPLAWVVRSKLFNMVIQPNRWEIQTETKEQRQRIIEVTTKLFDYLKTAQVPAIGINCMIHLDTKAKDVTEVIRRKVLSADLGISNLDGMEAQLAFRIHERSFTTTRAISPSIAGPSKLFVLQDHEIRPAVSNERPSVNVGDILRESAIRVWSDADKFGSSIVEKINAFGSDEHVA